ncbi:glycosyltransferase [Phenylobacterium sp.]|jgi:cellulose synthase/poly-beta-1,6-N-acetylglucosamine synthase-like glycosyltransferase|uniref:glycosyltransferase n=1 Tax=Phenylobacterium sp. TaxID=1871053 RepID=UPI00378325E6
MARVSIITPVKNAEAFLAQAVASVQRQDFTDWELLVVDDGSNDGSSAIAHRSAARDPRIRALAAAPGRAGAAASRNRGIEAANGEFVAFLDADDLYEPGKLSFDVATLTREPAAAMTFGPTHWWCERAPAQSWTESMRPFAGKLHAPPELLRKIILDQRGQVPCTCAVLVRRAALDEVGGFSEGFHLYEDQTLWVKLMLRYPVHVHDRVLCRYRQHPQSVSAQAEAAGAYDRMAPHAARTAFLEWIERYSTISGDPRLQRALRLAFAAYPQHRGRMTAADRLALGGRTVTRRLARFGRSLVRRTEALGVRR